MNMENKRVNGIFDEWDIQDDYAKIYMSSCSGFIKDDIRIKPKKVKSSAFFTNNVKDHIGLEITLVNERGEGVIYIPQKEIPILSELIAMRGSVVNYESKTWHSPMEGTSVDSKIVFASGSLSGRVYSGNEFA